ncbi:11181_t:CDS:2, partial [Diversispora eburnea]
STINATTNSSAITSLYVNTFDSTTSNMMLMIKNDALPKTHDEEIEEPLDPRNPQLLSIDYQFHHNNNNRLKDNLSSKPRSTTPTIANFQGPGSPSNSSRVKQDYLAFMANGGRLPQ